MIIANALMERRRFVSTPHGVEKAPLNREEVKYVLEQRLLRRKSRTGTL